jgi:F0F1-type ATP synthase membrane subunit a
VTINWSGKRRYIAGLLLLAGFLVMFNVPPVIPVIQLPGEVYPGREILGLPITNTLIGSVVAWIIIALLIVVVARNKPKDGSETPRGGFYNFFEMAFEGLYGFIGGVAGGKYLDLIFKVFMTIFLIVLFSNWQSIVPGVDSVGFLEPHVHENEETGELETLGGYDTLQISSGIFYLNGKCPWVSPADAALLTPADIDARKAANCTSGIGAAVEEVVHEEEPVAEEPEPAAAAPDEPVAEGTEVAAGEAVVTEGTETTAEHEGEAVAEGEEAASHEAEEGHHYAPGDPSVPWVVLPYVRPPSTDLNMTVAMALVAVVMTQYLGFRALKAGYLTKFFNFKTLFTSPLGGIDVAVGLLELIGEIARILSFAFRLLGNVFAGSVLLFVMSFLVPFLPWPFFLLEFGVGILQAFVFGFLTAIFMSQATASHHGDDHDDHEHVEEGAPAAAH